MEIPNTNQIRVNFTYYIKKKREFDFSAYVLLKKIPMNKLF